MTQDPIYAVIYCGLYIRHKGPCPEADGIHYIGRDLVIAEEILAGRLFDKMPLHFNSLRFKYLYIKALKG